MTEVQSCCPSVSWGSPFDVPHCTKSVDNANDGKSIMIGPNKDLEVYITKPVDTNNVVEKKVIMVFTDVYGLQNRLFAICDTLASDLNLYVVAIDCFRGETKDNHENDFLDWIKKHPYDISDAQKTANDIHPVKNDIEWCFEYLSQQFGIDKSNVGAIGFCWGVWAMTKAISSGIPFKCGLGFHPSIKLEDMQGGDQVSMARIASQKAPLLYCVSGNDPDNIKPGGEVAQIISSSKHQAEELKRQQPQCIYFPGTIHGWVSRGDTSDENVKRDAEKALTLGKDFLADWM